MSLRDVASDFGSFRPVKSGYSVELPGIETGREIPVSWGNARIYHAK